MNAEQFVNKIKEKRDIVFQGIIENLLDPPGRSPRKNLLEMSAFYKSLQDKDVLHKIIFDAVDSGIFKIFCILDHVSFIENTEEKTEFELYAVKGGERIRINDPDKEELHNLYNSLVLPED